MNKKLLLVDTNIISHALTSNQTPAYVGLFKGLEEDYRFVVTGFTKYELPCSSDREYRPKIEEYIQQEMALVSLSNELMTFAARIAYLYSKHVSTKGKKISTGDIINAAFSIAKNCHLLTIDNNDHPTPFFGERRRERVTYNSKRNREVTDTVYILEPDMINLKRCFEEHAA